MKLITLLAISILGLASLTVSAQVKPPTEPSSVLYEIARKDLTKPSYIFGTIHAVCPTDMVPFTDLDPYLGKTEQVLMEVDLDDTAELQSLAGGLRMADGKTLNDFLTPEQLAKIDTMLTSTVGYPAEAVKSIKPMMLTVMIVTSPKVLGCTPNTYDLTLMQKAVGMKKSVVGLETVASQLAMIDHKPIAVQAKELYEMSLDLPKAVNQLKDLMAAYKDRNSDRIFEISAAQMKDDKPFMKRLLDDRNAAWLPKIESNVKLRPTFIAVGAGHLGGPNGVIALLRAKGYQIKPIKLSPTAVGGN